MRGHAPDYILGLTVFALLGIGLVMIYSISPVLSHAYFGNASRNYYFYSQLGNMALGLLLWLVAANINYQIWQKLAWPLLLVSIIGLIVLFIPGLSVTTYGATRWLKFGPVNFQPAELLKLSLVLYLATWFDRRGDDVKTLWDGLVPFAVILGVFSIVVAFFQKDFGTMLVFVAAAVGMYITAGARLKHLAALIIGGLAAGWLAIVSFPHRLSRLSTFLHPSSDPTGAGYQINQAMIAIGSGGLFGLGLGKSIQVYGYLPEAANDSIFAIIGEEFGLVGATLIVGLFILLVWRGLKVAAEAPDNFSRLTAVGISLWLGSQFLINVAAMMSLVPLTGIPLPFISYGGTSLVFSLVAAGILLNISRYTVKEVAREDTRIWRRNGRSHLADPGHSRSAKRAR